MTTTTRRLSAALATGALALVLASCASDGAGSSDAESPAASESAQPEGDSQMIQQTDLDIAGSWALADNEAITLEISPEGVAAGSGGCNQISTTIHRDVTAPDSPLVVGPAISTRMACDDAVMDAENAFLQALESVTAGEVDGDTLTLTTLDGETLVFTSTTA